jgi:hypothetical protein
MPIFRKSSHRLLLLLILLVATVDWAVGGELTIEDRKRADRALVRKLGAEAKGYVFTSSGCDFDVCSSVVTRSAVFARRGLQYDGVLLVDEVQCFGIKDSSWSCSAPNQRAYFDLAGETFRPMLRNANAKTALAAAKYLSRCYLEAARKLDQKHAPPPLFPNGSPSLEVVEAKPDGSIEVELHSPGRHARARLEPREHDPECSFDLKWSYDIVY